MPIVVVSPFVQPYIFKANQFSFRNFKMAGRGGRRPGAGRPTGSAWKPKVSAMRVTSMNKMRRIVSAERDPLSVVVGFVLDDGMDINTRLTAASICLPYLFPKLS